jgi:hypothetical protein
MILLPPKKIFRLVEQAAELRAAGKSWVQVARGIGRPYQTVSKWPLIYRDFWDRVFAHASRHASHEATAEAQATLREMLRDKNLDLRNDAAKKLLDRRLPIDSPEETKPDSDLRRLADYLEGLSDDEVHTLMDLFDSDEPAGPSPDEGAAEPGTGPD